MALIRGLKGNCPCPICLVPSAKLADTSIKYPLRTAVESAELVNRTRGMASEAEREAILKPYGLRPIKVSTICSFHVNTNTLLIFSELVLENRKYRRTQCSVI